MRQRKLNRLKDYDYSQYGFYFVTICTGYRINHFGKILRSQTVGTGQCPVPIENGDDDFIPRAVMTMNLNQYGKIAEYFWRKIPAHYTNVYLDEFVIMPNHIHGIIIIGGGNRDVKTEQGTEQCSVPTKTKNVRSKNYGLLSKIIKSYKDVVIKEIKKQGNDYQFQWQRSFYDHIIRHESALERIRTYIADNPLKWEADKNNPQNLFM